VYILVLIFCVYLHKETNEIMTTTEIIKAKVIEQIKDNASGFRDVFNGVRVEVYTHYHLGIITVSIDGFSCAEFDRFNAEPIYTYIINAVSK